MAREEDEVSAASSIFGFNVSKYRRNASDTASFLLLPILVKCQLANHQMGSGEQRGPTEKPFHKHS